MTYDQLNRTYGSEVLRKVIKTLSADELSIENVAKRAQEYISTEEYANEQKAKLKLIENNKRERERRLGNLM